MLMLVSRIVQKSLPYQQRLLVLVLEQRILWLRSPKIGSSSMLC